MVATLKRQLTDDEKAIVLGRFGRHCYANGHAIPDDEQVQFDHIRAHGLGGDSELNNIAPMYAQHNREKSQLSLGDFRIKLQLDEFFCERRQAHFATFTVVFKTTKAYRRVWRKCVYHCRWEYRHPGHGVGTDDACSLSVPNYRLALFLRNARCISAR